MSTPPTSAPNDTPDYLDDLEDIDPRDALFIAYLEDDLSPAERNEFRADLLRDPDLRREFDEFVEIMDAMESLPAQSAPADFIEQVQSRIRAGSHGRFFGAHPIYRSHTPYEAISAAMIALMAAAWILSGAPRDHDLRHVAENIPPRLEISARADSRY
jgi:anti-sigma factor RsiW